MPRRLPTAATVETESEITGSAGRGWAAHKNAKKSRTVFAKEFQVPEGDEKLIKFLDEEPFESYYRHWLRNIKGKQTFVCLGEDCPLCEKGDNPTFIVLFNVIDMVDDTDLVKVWAATPNPAGVIEDLAFSGKWFSPINGESTYFSVSKKKGQNGFFAYSIMPVKERDLEDEWEGITPLTADQLKTAGETKFGSEYIRAETRQALRELADSLED